MPTESMATKATVLPSGETTTSIALAVSTVVGGEGIENW
jgi:hypothetical protein